jgi:hypothetical protein
LSLTVAKPAEATSGALTRSGHCFQARGCWPICAILRRFPSGTLSKSHEAPIGHRCCRRVLVHRYAHRLMFTLNPPTRAGFEALGWIASWPLAAAHLGPPSDSAAADGGRGGLQ